MTTIQSPIVQNVELSAPNEPAFTAAMPKTNENQNTLAGLTLSKQSNEVAHESSEKMSRSQNLSDDDIGIYSAPFGTPATVLEEDAYWQAGMDFNTNTNRMSREFQTEATLEKLKQNIAEADYIGYNQAFDNEAKRNPYLSVLAGSDQDDARKMADPMRGFFSSDFDDTRHTGSMGGLDNSDWLFAKSQNDQLQSDYLKSHGETIKSAAQKQYNAAEAFFDKRDEYFETLNYFEDRAVSANAPEIAGTELVHIATSRGEIVARVDAGDSHLSQTEKMTFNDKDGKTVEMKVFNGTKFRVQEEGRKIHFEDKDKHNGRVDSAESIAMFTDMEYFARPIQYLHIPARVPYINNDGEVATVQRKDISSLETNKFGTLVENVAVNENEKISVFIVGDRGVVELELDPSDEKLKYSSPLIFENNEGDIVSKQVVQIDKNYIPYVDLNGQIQAYKILVDGNGEVVTDLMGVPKPETSLNKSEGQYLAYNKYGTIVLNEFKGPLLEARQENTAHTSVPNATNNATQNAIDSGQI